MRKTFNLSDENIELLMQVKAEFGFATEGEAANFIFNKYIEHEDQQIQEQMMIDKLLNQFDEKYYKFFERLKWATRTSEQNSMVLLDAVNTLLFKEHVEGCILVDKMKAEPIKISMEYSKNKIAHFKQVKDDRKNKKDIGE